MKQNMDIKFFMKFSAQPVWSVVTDIRKQINSLIEKKGFTIDTLETLEIVCMELFENAIKYGLSTDDASDVSLEISYSKEHELNISVSNGIESVESVQAFIDFLDKIKNAKDLEALYMERLKEIAENPKTGQSQLGLFRIAYETEFNLKYEISGKKITVIATKKLEEAA
jgi:hypothetical protein